MSQTWKINNLELEFDIFDLENSEKYEKAFEKMSSEEKAIKRDGKMSEFIRSYCDMYYHLFENLFGTEIAESLCKRYNSNEWEQVYGSFLDYVQNQNNEAQKMRASIVNRSANRATRRANQKKSKVKH